MGPIGSGTRISWLLPSGGRLVDTHVDHAGWAFVFGVYAGRDADRFGAVADHVLHTWRRLEPDPLDGAGPGLESGAASGTWPSAP
ncbi:hypothetical protein [Cellulomonas alba]|uniref:Uncharacterized protein n=1 Tax=Cellulomonas alba TaxID=3053467 RepID=A0ABT7SDL2_9CELL|nr:hypothetical protein [Cellulomonas alba]MDM7854275.1 hypothetical protein [Cellulomonas alba]